MGNCIPVWKPDVYFLKVRLVFKHVYLFQNVDFVLKSVCTFFRKNRVSFWKIYTSFKYIQNVSKLVCVSRQVVYYIYHLVPFLKLEKENSMGTVCTRSM